MTTGEVLPHDWFPAPLPPGVVLHEGSWLYSSFAFLHSRSRRGVIVGRSSGVYNGCFFDLGPEGRVEIGNYCSLVGVVISSNGPVVIGDFAFLAHEVVLAADDFGVPPCAHDDQPRRESKSIVIGDNAWIGARAVLLGGARIGADAVVGAGAVVRGEVPAGATAAGNPARTVRGPRPVRRADTEARS